MKYLKGIRPKGCKVNYFIIVKGKMPHHKSILRLKVALIALNNIYFNFFQKKLDFSSFIWHN